MSADRHVTRDVDPTAVRDLLERPPRVAVAFVRDGVADVLPARLRSEGDRHRFAIRGDVDPELSSREVVLLIDDGPYWFELRGISLRGVATRAADTDADGLVWYDLGSGRVLAWDYGAVREE